MAFSDVLQKLGRLIGLYPDEPAEYDDPLYDDYEARTEQAGEDAEYQSGYGVGGTYVRAGARPRPASSGRIVEPTPATGLFGRGRQERQPSASNVIRMPERGPEREPRYESEPVRPPQQGYASTIIFCVRRKDDSSQIINYLLSGVNVILNFEEVDDAQCQRVLDMVSGAAFALRGSVERISHRNYLVAPTGVEVVRSETQGRGAYDDGYAARIR